MVDELTVIASSYHRNGYSFPVDAMSPELALAYRSQFEAGSESTKTKTRTSMRLCLVTPIW